jgi:hypothetical protein
VTERAGEQRRRHAGSPQRALHDLGLLDGNDIVDRAVDQEKRRIEFVDVRDR